MTCWWGVPVTATGTIQPLDSRNKLPLSTNCAKNGVLTPSPDGCLLHSTYTQASQTSADGLKLFLIHGLGSQCKDNFSLVSFFYLVEFDGCESNMVNAYLNGTACPPHTEVCNRWWSGNGVCFIDAVIIDLMIGILAHEQTLNR